MSGAGPWFCPTCGHSCETPYCAVCGERKPHPDELTLTGLAKQAFDAFTSYDSRLWLTLRTLMLKPGTLSLMYVHGSRRAYIGPFALFLLANVFFVGMEAFTGSNIFASRLETELYMQPWDFYARELVAARLDELHMTLEDYAPRFDRDVVVHARSLIIIMVFPFALLPALLFSRSHLPFASHLAFSLHFHAFLLTLFGLLLTVPFVYELLGGGDWIGSPLDKGIAVAALLACGTYLYCAAGKVYGVGGLMRVIKASVLALVAMLIFFGYRFFLFILTLYTTGA